MNRQDPPDILIAKTKPNEVQFTSQDIAELQQFRRKWAIVSITALFLWTYGIIKLSAFDIDVAVMKTIRPDLVWILDFKIVIVAAGLALLFLVFKTWGAALILLYILAYPAIVLFWTIPRMIFRRKSWLLFFAFLNTVLSVCVSIKDIVMFGALAICSTAIILATQIPSLLFIAAILQLLLLVTAYYRRCIAGFKTSKIISAHKKMFSVYQSLILGIHKQGEVLRKLKGRRLTKEKKSQLDMNLKLSVLLSRFYVYLGRRLRLYQTTGANFFSAVATVVFLAMSTISVFTLVNFALFKSNPLNYVVVGNPNLFGFFYYSVNQFVHNSIPQISPQTLLAQLVQMTNFVLVWFLGAIVISHLIVAKNQKNDIALLTMIDSVERDGEKIESRILADYQVPNAQQLASELRRAEETIISLVFQFSKFL